MTDPIRHNWPQIIRELEAAGFTTYKIGLTIGVDHTTVENWRDHPLPIHDPKRPEPRHFIGEMLLAFHAEYGKRPIVPCETSGNSA